ncbi:MAG: cyclodeaminase/cyclohydrolase family protein [Phycisphaerales bacterium]|nr:MAG: cyclodeaminase/cyclohydrolase family protein [Phycisphaerales bacterium]
MDDFTQLNVAKFLDQVADRTPTPGGGGVTGLAGAAACAMGRMVAAYSVGKKTGPEKRRQVEAVMAHLARADQLMRALITRDAEAYKTMADAAKAKGEDPSTQSAYQDAVLAAIAVPMEMAAISSAALSTMAEFAGIASKYLISDLGIAAVLADAAARAAAYSVLVNAREITDASVKAKVLSDLGAMLEHCAQHRESIEATVADRLEIDPPASR